MSMYEPDQQPAPDGGHAAADRRPYPLGSGNQYPPNAAYAYPPPPGSVPPPGGYAPGQPYAGYAPQIPPARRHNGFAWLWWVLGLLVFFTLFGCILTSIIASIGSKGGGFSGGDKIAVIPFEGTISGTGSPPSVMTPEDFLKMLQRAEDDDSVKAIVLRVNSPGGTVAASQEISEYVRTEKKPVIVSVGDVDASGAYMVSSQADWIVGNPGSAIGSIGVIMEVPNASGLMDKIGVQWKVITAGKYKGAGSPFRPLTPTETGLLQGQIDQVYAQFIDTVASGRKLPRSEVESMATGWAWNGEEAVRLKLIDQTGTYKDALKVAARKGKIKGHYDVEVYQSTQFSGILGSLLGIESQLQLLNSANSVDSTSLRRQTLAK
jgi:protease-4